MYVLVSPIFDEFNTRIHAANFSLCAGVMPPTPILGKCSLYNAVRRVAHQHSKDPAVIIDTPKKNSMPGRIPSHKHVRTAASTGVK
ncbi:hypothetical protein D3C80_1211590 [compost metagenome]